MIFSRYKSHEKHANNKLFKANGGYKLKRKRKEKETERIDIIFNKQHNPVFK